ncbi:hypothetical protein CGRA01v4_02666 [Colletotrichum graminicola]|nr:hypothetical protein CGRA01v4_02666 [Colletotrichum graminicola]
MHACLGWTRGVDCFSRRPMLPVVLQLAFAVCLFFCAAAFYFYFYFVICSLWGLLVDLLSSISFIPATACPPPNACC